MDYKNLPDSIKAKISEAQWNSLDNNTKAGLSDGLTKMAKDFASSVTKRVEASEPDRINLGNQNLGGISDTLSAIAQRGEVATKALRDMAQAGGFFFLDGPAAKGLDPVINNLDKTLGSAEAGAQAFKTLSTTMENFNLLNVKMGKGTQLFSAELATQAGMLKQLGMSFNSFQKNADLAIYSLGMNAEEVKKFNFSIKTLSKDLNMLPDEVSRNFQLVAKNLAYDTNKIKDQFVKFQTMSQKTGIDIGTLSSQFGGRMDTIQGASSAAANINTLLGRNQFSATELLMMDDADRAKAIREAVMGDKDIMKDINAGGAQGKFAMLSIAESLNMDRDTARRFIQTGKADSVKNQIGKGVDERLGKDLDSAKVKSFTEGTTKMTDAMDQATKEIMRTLGPMRAALLGQRKGFLEDLETGKADTTYQELGVTARLGIIPGQGNVEQVTKAMARNPGSQDTVKRLVEAAQMGIVDNDQLAKILKGLINQNYVDNEGDFLPETYFFSYGYSRNSLLERMKKELINIIDYEWNKRDSSLPYKNKNEALVIASLIESEASLDQERKLIASVFINRLRKNMRLQSDPTVKYGLEKLHKLKIKTIKKSHLKIDHPWNTYTRNGLPITPICNPGKKSIIAALNPVNSDYLYFVADKKGGHFFAKTLKEHNTNINYTKKNTLSKLNDNSSIFFSDNDLPLSKPKNK